jgi:putative DNA primase/helicase
MSADLIDLGIAYRAHGPAEQRVPCPRCDRGPHDTALGVNIATGIWHCFRCGWSGRAATETRPASVVAQLDDPDRAERVRARLRETWKAAVPLTQAGARPVRNYLAARGLGELLAVMPSCLRAHPSLPYFDTVTRREIGNFPAMIAMLVNRFVDPPIATLHATYLSPEGSTKAKVPSPKKILGVATRGATKGAAVRLYEPRKGRLAVTEGIENALSMVVLHRIPTWASFCADNLAVVKIPPLNLLLIGVDVDENNKGEDAARALMARVKREQPNAEVRLIIPAGSHVPRDLNDALLRRHRMAG